MRAMLNELQLAVSNFVSPTLRVLQLCPHLTPLQVCLALARPREAADAAAAAAAAAAAGGGVGEGGRSPQELLATIKASCSSVSDAVYVENVMRSIA